jgi:F-type H+-transporting ATPase subunit alpha
MSAPPNSLQNVFDQAFAGFSRSRQTFSPQLTLREIGTITSVSAGIARVSGLPGVGSDELVSFPGDVFGIAFNIDADEIGIVLLGEYWHLHAGDEVRRTGRVMDVPVGDGLLGRVIDPLGRPLDGQGPVAASGQLPIERPAAPIMDRAPVTVPLQTGLKVIDALIPVGRGQRELILGDRQTGKTAIAIDTILNQRGKDVLCVYCAIGQRGAASAKAVATFRQKKAMAYTVVVVTEGNDAPGLAHIAPYAATSIAEHFMEQGRDVLIVYDGLTHHARAYRELSLLLRRPPGREAFPGDIFYIHSRLLERATHLQKEQGGGSLTALPIIETEAQNISAYIPTNLISTPMGKSISRRRCSNWAYCRRSISVNPFRVLVARRNGLPTARWRATSNSPTRNLKNLRSLPGSVHGWMKRTTRSSCMDSASGPASNSRNSPRCPWSAKSPYCWP